MAYTVKPLVIGNRRVEKEHGTGSGTLFVLPIYSGQGEIAVDIVFIVSEETPSTTDTYGIGSLWNDITNGKLYIKTGATTWTVVGAQS